MSQFKDFMRQKGISHAYIKKETNYSLSYISQVLNEHWTPSTKFQHLFFLALIKFAHQDINQLKTLLKDSPWKHLI